LWAHSPTCRPFRYFIVLVYASTRWSYVCLISTRNLTFTRLLAQIIRLRAQFSDYIIKTICLDNDGEFTSQAFNDYCMLLGINIEHLVAHVHTQNVLVESLIKCLQLIARPLLMRTKLLVSAWRYVVLHATLIHIRSTTYHKFFPLQLAFDHEPNIFHLIIFGCAVYVPIYMPQHTKMDPQRRLGIYIGFESLSIIKYLEPLTSDSFMARFVDCHFNETMFPVLEGEIKQLERYYVECIVIIEF